MKLAIAVLLGALITVPASAGEADYESCIRAAAGPFSSEILNECTTYLEISLGRYRLLLQETDNARYRTEYEQHLDLALLLSHWFALSHEQGARE